MSRLNPSLLALDKGLDLQTAKILAPEGSVLDSINYEQVDFQGQKRIEGYSRFDGTVMAAFDDYVLMTFIASGCFIGIPEDVSYTVHINDKLWGITLGPYGLDGDAGYVAIIDHTITPKEGDDLKLNSVPTGSIVSVTSGRDLGLTPDEYYQSLLTLNTKLRPRTGSLPGGIAGLHWFRDKLYAVANILRLSVSGASADYIGIPAEIKNSTSYIIDATNSYVDVISTADVAVGDYVNTDRGNLQVTAVSVINKGSLYVTLNEQQALDEASKAGWNPVHLGWKVYFTAGAVPYGALTAINQNRQNVGVQGPTSTEGNSGSPSLLFQAAVITNKNTQVRGWKSFDSPEAYVIDPADVQQEDNAYIYADGFISWTADSSIVNISGSDGNGLVEYPPTNKIVYTAFS